jgi:hypothetical protein
MVIDKARLPGVHKPPSVIRLHIYYLREAIHARQLGLSRTKSGSR